jgi:transposase-like protein
MTCYQKIHCPQCDSTQIIKSGKSVTGTQRYLCQNIECKTQTFMQSYRYKACEPGITEKIVEMAINSSGIRDTARVLKINKNTVINTLKKREAVLFK